MSRLSLVLVLLTGFALLANTGCRGIDSSEARPAPALVMPQPTVSARQDSIGGMTDGGEVTMARVRQNILIREDSAWARALRVHYNAIVLDGHIDTPTLMLDRGYRFAERHRIGNVDLPRMYEGGLDAAFFSIYVAPPYGEGEQAVQRARDMMAELKRQVGASSDSMALAYSAADVRRITRSGRKAVLMGLEGGHALAGSLDVLRELHDAGIRYVTLTHINTNSWADASQAPPRWNGLNDLGRKMVREMNRLGVLVDLAHVSDSTFYDALAVSEAPVLVSHSSMRALTPGVRNIDDDMLRALAKNGGVVMINFFDAMVNPHITDEIMEEAYTRLPGQDLHDLWSVVYDVMRERGVPHATVEDVVDHIDHAVKVAGIDHVGIGSDFDGVFDLPDGLWDCTRLPWITYGLVKRGYSDEDIYKILGGNALRVLEDAERVSHRLQAHS
ncbi:MAG TPA: dipeptidase [Rhodothermales bacterium]|nr:dipeptidase [Rhodothermales bacterium]